MPRTKGCVIKYPAWGGSDCTLLRLQHCTYLSVAKDIVIKTVAGKFHSVLHYFPFSTKFRQRMPADVLARIDKERPSDSLHLIMSAGLVAPTIGGKTSEGSRRQGLIG